MRPSAIIPLIAATLALAVACGTDGPTPAVNLQSAAEVKKAAVELFDSWLDATNKHDAAAVRRLLASNISDNCTVEEFEQFFERDENALTYPAMQVKDVFVAEGDPDRAFMTMELTGEPRPGRRGEIDAYVAAIPYPIVREDGRWRMLMQFVAVEEGCPFSGSFSSQTPVPADSATPSP
ncbi:MAG: hypothetical protein IH872_00500 [Chloroflexi bacterium]|nr:hypothetical protein [Chloroflexota bacterium]